MHRVACWGHFYCLTHLQIKIKFHKSCRLVQNCLFRLGSMLVSIYTLIHFCQNSFYNDFMLHNPFFTTIAIGHCVLFLLYSLILCVSFFKAIEIICCTRKLPFTIPHVHVSYTHVWVSMSVYVWIFWHIKSMLWQALLVKRGPQKLDIIRP